MLLFPPSFPCFCQNLILLPKLLENNQHSLFSRLQAFYKTRLFTCFSSGPPRPPQLDVFCLPGIQQHQCLLSAGAVIQPTAFLFKINTAPDSALIIAGGFGKAGALVACDVDPKNRCRKKISMNIKIIIPHNRKTQVMP